MELLQSFPAQLQLEITKEQLDGRLLRQIKHKTLLLSGNRFSSRPWVAAKIEKNCSKLSSDCSINVGFNPSISLSSQLGIHSKPRHWENPEIKNPAAAKSAPKAFSPHASKPEGQSEAFPAKPAAKPAAGALIAAHVLAILELLPDKQTRFKFSSTIIIIGEEN